MAQTYCVRADVESIVGTSAVLSCIDDDMDGAESATETTYVTDAIERAAVEMNGKLRNQYLPLSDLSGNDWCKWCNAYLALDYLYERRGNPAPNSVLERCQKYRDNLEDAAWGRFEVPEQIPSAEHIPTVTNFHPEIGRIRSPIRVSDTESTGSPPSAESRRKREVANQPGWW